MINAKKIGLQSIELTGPDEWEILKKYDMTAAIGWGKYPDGMNIPNFFNRTKNHDALVGFYEDIIPKAAKAGVKNIITFSGNRDGMSDEDGLINCKKGLHYYDRMEKGGELQQKYAAQKEEVEALLAELENKK